MRQYSAMDSYIVRLTRRENVKGNMQPEETMLFKFRKQPKSVYMKWIGPQGEGREATYVEGRFEGKLHTRLAAGDSLLFPSGKVISLDPDSPLIRANSRHCIKDAGVGTLIERFGKLLAAMEKGDNSQGTVVYLGPQKRPEFLSPVEAVAWTVPPGVDTSLPKGGRRWCYFDGDKHLPSLIITQDEHGHEVEYYLYDRYIFPTNLDDDDFNPDKLWGKPKK
jgi:hypothetical protein